MEKTFRAGATITPASVRKGNLQVVFCTQEKCVFRGTDTEKRETLMRKQLGNKADYLAEGATALVRGGKTTQTSEYQRIVECGNLGLNTIPLLVLKQGVWWEDRLIDVELPPTVELEVTDTEPPSKTNSKPATLETGLTISVPGFVEEGNRVIVNTGTGRYVSRA